MQDLMLSVETSLDPFRFLADLRRDQPESFGAFANELLASSSRNPGLWRYLGMHFIRAERYDLAAVAANRHMALSPENQEAFLRRYRIALLAADSEVARKMLDEHRDRLSPFHYECNRFLYLKRFVGGLIPMERDLARLKDYSCAEFNRGLVKELSVEAQDVAALNTETRPRNQSWDSIANTCDFARLISMLDGVRKVTVLGNGGSLRGAKLGQYIDAQEFVVRINFPDITDLAADVGTRTDIVLFTEAFLHTADNFESLKLLRAPYGDVPGLAIDAARKDRVEKLTRFEGTESKISLVPIEVRTIIRALSYEFATTGLCTLVLMSMLLRKEIAVFGFDFYSAKSAIHFFSKTSKEAFIGHETVFEAFVVNSVYGRLDSSSMPPAAS